MSSLHTGPYQFGRSRPVETNRWSASVRRMQTTRNVAKGVSGNLTLLGEASPRRKRTDVELHVLWSSPEGTASTVLVAPWVGFVCQRVTAIQCRRSNSAGLDRERQVESATNRPLRSTNRSRDADS